MLHTNHHRHSSNLMNGSFKMDTFFDRHQDSRRSSVDILRALANSGMFDNIVNPSGSESTNHDRGSFLQDGINMAALLQDCEPNPLEPNPSPLPSSDVAPDVTSLEEEISTARTAPAPPLPIPFASVVSRGSSNSSSVATVEEQQERASTSSSLSHDNNNNDGLPVVERPGDWDIVCGRNSGGYHSVGNRRFRVLVQLNMEAYLRAPSRADKTRVIEALVHTLQTQVGARFLKKVKVSGYMVLEDEKDIRNKVAHTMRDMIQDQKKHDKTKEQRRVQ